MKLLTAILSSAVVAIAHAEPVEFTQEIRTKATPEAVWESLTKPELVKIYHLAPLQKIELKKGGEILYGRENKVMISGSITDIAPNARLAHTFRFGPPQLPATQAAGDTLVTYAIRTDGAETVLKLTHSGFTAKNPAFTNATGGWPFILKKLKSLLDAKPTP